MRYIFVLTWNIPRHKRDLGNALFGVFSGFEECFGLGWVSLCTCYSLLFIIHQYRSIDCLSLIYRRGGPAHFFMLTTSASSLRDTHDHSRTIRYKSITSANGGTYAGQYPCNGWVDNLKSTRLITNICFLIQGHNLKETIN